MTDFEAFRQLHTAPREPKGKPRCTPVIDTDGKPTMMLHLKSAPPHKVIQALDWCKARGIRATVV